MHPSTIVRLRCILIFGTVCQFCVNPRGGFQMKDLVTQINNAAGKGNGPVSKARMVDHLPSFSHCELPMVYVETSEQKGGPGDDWICCQSCDYARRVRDCTRAELDLLRLSEGDSFSDDVRPSWWKTFWGKRRERSMVDAVQTNGNKA